MDARTSSIQEGTQSEIKALRVLNEELADRSAQLRSLMTSIIESPLLNFSPNKEGMSFHDKVVFSIDNMARQRDELIDALAECKNVIIWLLDVSDLTEENAHLRSDFFNLTANAIQVAGSALTNCRNTNNG